MQDDQHIEICQEVPSPTGIGAKKENPLYFRPDRENLNQTLEGLLKFLYIGGSPLHKVHSAHPPLQPLGYLSPRRTRPYLFHRMSIQRLPSGLWESQSARVFQPSSTISTPSAFLQMAPPLPGRGKPRVPQDLDRFFGGYFGWSTRAYTDISKEVGLTDSPEGFPHRFPGGPPHGGGWPP